ncbi:MAG: helix-turn-helix domain-containing protein [Bacteroidales bacterium]|nr:helix-turn-helix domain-containing protein [Bacteroidales bacterium]
MVLHYEPAATIQDVSYRLGFKDQTSFTRYFKRENGFTPTEFRQQVNAGSDTVQQVILG